MLEHLKEREKVIGLKQTIKAVHKNSCEVVYIASDVDTDIISHLLEMCKNNGVKIDRSQDMRQLGKACGIDVGASAVGILSQ